jgi:hypothetical protein
MNWMTCTSYSRILRMQFSDPAESRETPNGMDLALEWLRTADHQPHLFRIGDKLRSGSPISDRRRVRRAEVLQGDGDALRNDSPAANHRNAFGRDLYGPTVGRKTESKRGECSELD